MPPVPAPGVPESVPVPLPLSVKVTPLGSVPLRAMLGVGSPVVVTLKLPAVPTTKVVLLALVMAGGWVGCVTVILAVTIWLSTVAVALPAPALVPVKVEVRVPLVSVLLVGLIVPRTAVKLTGVPFGTVKPVWLFEFLVIEAVTVEV